LWRAKRSERLQRPSALEVVIRAGRKSGRYGRFLDQAPDTRGPQVPSDASEDDVRRARVINSR